MAVGSRARRGWVTLRAERRTLRQGLVALTLSTIAGLLAGLTLAHVTGRLDHLPGLLVLIPAAVGMRGTIFGAIGARLGTANAAGLYRPTFERDGVLVRNVSVAVLTTFTSALWLAVLAKVACTAFGIRSISVWSLVTISVVGGALGSAVILAITIGLSALSFRRGWDLDAVSTPMVTALGDVATIPTMVLASFLLDAPVVNAIVSGLCTAAALAAGVRSFTSPIPGVRRIAREMTPVILLTPVLDVAAGGLLQRHEAALFVVPAVLSIVPPFVSQAGALGGIYASRIASKLHLGLIGPSRWPERPARVDGALAAAAGVVVFALIGAVTFALAVATHLSHPGAARMVGGTLLAGAVAIPVALSLAYAVSIVTTRFGLDPDDHGVPIITSVMDLSGVAVLLLAMTVVGVSGG